LIYFLDFDLLDEPNRASYGSLLFYDFKVFWPFGEIRKDYKLFPPPSMMIATS
jgi:hypothetical protein